MERVESHRPPLLAQKLIAAGGKKSSLEGWSLTCCHCPSRRPHSHAHMERINCTQWVIFKKRKKKKERKGGRKEERVFEDERELTRDNEAPRDLKKWNSNAASQCWKEEKVAFWSSIKCGAPEHSAAQKAPWCVRLQICVVLLFSPLLGQIAWHKPV